MADRKLVVAIVGDDRSLQQAFTRSTASADKFGRTMKTRLGGGVSVAGNFAGLLDDTKAMQKEADGLSSRLKDIGKSSEGAAPGLAGLAGRAGALGLAFTAAYQGSSRLGDLLETTGEKAFTTAGRFQNLGASLARLDIVGAIAGLSAVPKTLDEAGVSALEARNNYEDFKRTINSGFEPLAEISRQAVALVDAEKAATAAQDALADSTARLGTAFRDATGQAVTFKGAVDDLGGPRGPGGVDQINAALEANRFPKFPKPLKPLGPSAKNAAAQTVAQAQGDLPGLLRLQKVDQERLAKALELSQGNVKQRAALNQQLAQATAAVISTQNAIQVQGDAAAKAAATARATKLREHWDAVIGALTNAVSAAELTAGLRDDVKALEALASGLKQQIKAGLDVTASQAKLIAVTGQIAAKQNQIVENRAKAQKAAEQARQFRTIGLDPTGNKPPPAIANLKKQVSQLFSRDDLATNDKGVLARIRKVLIDPINKATPETRAAVQRILDAMRDGFDKGLKGPLTKTASLNANKLLEGLGLGRDMEKELRARLSSFNSAGVALAGTKRPTGNFVGRQQPIVVENHTTVQLDGETVGRSVTRTQQKTKRRNTTQKRGPNSGV